MAKVIPFSSYLTWNNIVTLKPEFKVIKMIPIESLVRFPIRIL